MVLTPFTAAHATGVAEVAAAVGWPSLTDPALVITVCTAPGATAFVALDSGRVIGFAQALGDGVLQSHLSFLAVLPAHRRRGIARRLVAAVFAATGTRRMDLITEDGDAFYRSLPHRGMSGYRIYPEAPGRAVPPR